MVDSMLLFDDNFPIKMFIVNTIGLNDSDWVKVQPKRSLSDIKKENTFIMLPQNKDLVMDSIPMEVVKLFKIWGFDGFDTTTIVMSKGKPEEKRVPKSPILREQFQTVFGKDEDWSQAKMRGLQNLALIHKTGQPKGQYEVNIRNQNYEIPMWAVEK
tara:strand:- start:12235 stop:12705 length:471 start_codon:yes stop_codon:yes gene_type:complete